MNRLIDTDIDIMGAAFVNLISHAAKLFLVR